MRWRTFRPPVTSDRSPQPLGSRLMWEPAMLSSRSRRSVATNWKDCATFSNDATNSNTDPGVLNGYVGTDANNAIDPGTLDSWFTPAVFKGAVENGDDWTQGWTLPL